MKKSQESEDAENNRLENAAGREMYNTSDRNDTNDASDKNRTKSDTGRNDVNRKGNALDKVEEKADRAFGDIENAL